MNSIKAYLTDLDGTLCNTIEANIAAYELAFQEAGIDFDELSYRENFGLGFHEMMKVIAPQHELAWEAISQNKSIHYEKHMSLIEPNLGLIKILRDAKASGKMVGLASTSKRRNATFVLETLGLTDLFDVSLFAEDVTYKKPNPECYLSLAKKLGVKPSECIVFEDTDIGVLAASEAGMPSLRVTI